MKMKIVKVSYTVKPEFARQNIDNIEAVMNDLKKSHLAGIFYFVCVDDDAKTFTHTAIFNSAEHQKLLTGLPSFKYFQEQLKSSGPEVPPRQEMPTLVGSSTETF